MTSETHNMPRPFTPDDQPDDGLTCDPCRAGRCYDCEGGCCWHLCESDEYDPADDDGPPWETVTPNEAYL